MNLVDWLKRVMVSTGAAWVMWLMIALSVISVAIILERAWFYNSLRDDLARLAKDLQNALDASIESAQKRLSQSPSAEAAVVCAGLAAAHRGAAAAEEAMEGAKALQRVKLERRLAFLATLGNNAPFIGLFGTVIGVVMAFDALGSQKLEAGSAQLAPQAVMSSIGEALVATAVGIGVAIPAVAANNVFQRITKSTLANTEALSRVLLSHLKSTNPVFSPYRGVTEEVASKDGGSRDKAKKAEPKKGGKAESKPAAPDDGEEDRGDDEEKA